jgi:hypothetical protein
VRNDDIYHFLFDKSMRTLHKTPLINMSGFALTKQEMRCCLCIEQKNREFSIGICSFCYEESKRKVIHQHNNKIMRYREIDFFSHFYETLPENSVLMIWLSYTTDEGTIKMWHGILQAAMNKQNQLAHTPLSVFENQAHAIIRDYKEVYEVICCKIGS